MKLLLLLFSGLKFGKILTTSGSMLVSIFAYSLIFGWRYALGFVLLIFFHEMGHYLAAKKLGLNVGAPTFIPFVGAWIALKELPLKAEDEAYIGIAGPFIGTIAAFACYLWALNSGSNLFLAISYAGFFINLFNLIPLPPFDGGRITAAISRKMWFVGAPILVGVFLWRPSPILILMIILAAPHIWNSLRGKRDMNEKYYDVPFAKRVEYGLLYFGLLAYLSVMSSKVYDMLSYM
ncbi:MAG: site-2 protease family protein [Campylobacteraceae bacterium]|jgi:Zn-dependent protease|nr:site-2 protease family protein [Campylobacteraceae bacterium]